MVLPTRPEKMRKGFQMYDLGKDPTESIDISAEFPERFERMKAALDASATDGRITLDLELVFGHCWGGGPKMDPLNYRIDAEQIPIRRN